DRCLDAAIGPTAMCIDQTAVKGGITETRTNRAEIVQLALGFEVFFERRAWEEIQINAALMVGPGDVSNGTDNKLVELPVITNLTTNEGTACGGLERAIRAEIIEIMTHVAEAAATDHTNIDA